MNKKLCFPIVVFITLILSFNVAFADSAVLGGSYVTVGTTELNKVTIYFPYDYNDGWCFINGLPVHQYNSTITGYILNSNGTGRYAVRMYNYCNGWEYRTYGGTGTYSTLHVNAYFPQESSIFVKKYHGSTENYILYGIILLMGILCVSIFYKRSSR